MLHHQLNEALVSLGKLFDQIKDLANPGRGEKIEKYFFVCFWLVALLVFAVLLQIHRIINSHENGENIPLSLS